MIEHLLDNNVISQILKGNQTVTNFVLNLDFAICAIVYIEALQGSISNSQKNTIKKLIDNFPLLLITPDISRRAIELINSYSNSHGLMLADALIAATALENDLTLVTYNIDDFKFIKGLKYLKPTI
ncbi:MAG: type II toxin-antitoxin system VapC family toxin [Pyrinomonadaceae bacterium]